MLLIAAAQRKEWMPNLVVLDSDPDSDVTQLATVEYTIRAAAVVYARAD